MFMCHIIILYILYADSKEEIVKIDMRHMEYSGEVGTLNPQGHYGCANITIEPEAIPLPEIG